MKKNKQPMKKSTKTLFTICIVCLVLGIGCSTIGLLQGTSSWAYWDGKQMLTSNSVGTYEEKKSLEPFASVEIGIPSVKCNITEGDGYAIDVRSCWPGIKPVLKLENGKLSLKTESAQPTGCIRINGNDSVFENANYINITVPKGTKLDLIEFSQQSDWFRNDYFGVIGINVTGLKAKELKSTTGTYDIPISIENCEIDAINFANTDAISMRNMTVGRVEIALKTSGSRGSSAFSTHHVTVNELVVNHPDYDKAKLLNPANLGSWKENYAPFEINLDDSVFGVLDMIAPDITLTNVTSSKTTAIARAQLTVNGGSFKGETILRSAGIMNVNLPEKVTDFSGLLAVGPGYQEGIITELAAYGTPGYDYGFVTEESKKGGTQQVPLTQDEYYYLSGGNSYQYQEGRDNQKDTFATTAVGGIQTDNYSKFRDYVDLAQKYMENRTEHYAQVYNQKVVRYYLDQNGNPVYVSDNAAVPPILKINGETQMAPRMGLENGKGNRLDIYSRYSAEFNFGL